MHGRSREHCARAVDAAPRDQHRPLTRPKGLTAVHPPVRLWCPGIKNLRGKTILFAFSSAFRPGISAFRSAGLTRELHGAFTSLTEHVMAAQSYTASGLSGAVGLPAAFLVSLIYLCGFHLWGSIFMGAYFAFKGTVLGVCASAIYASGGARALVVYWLLNCLPELVLSAFMLWLAHSSCRASQSLSSIVFSGCRCALNGAIRRLSALSALPARVRCQQLYVFRFSCPLRQCPALNPSSLWTAVQYSQYPQGERLPPPVSTAAG